MNVLNGVNNFLRMIDNNWTTIVVTIALGISVYKKVKGFLEKSDDKKIEIAKNIVCETMLERVSTAEKEYADWVKAGAAKRAQVIAKVYADYPILAKVVDQEGLIAWIDETIKEALKVMREMIKEKTEE